MEESSSHGYENWISNGVFLESFDRPICMLYGVFHRHGNHIMKDVVIKASLKGNFAWNRSISHNHVNLTRLASLVSIWCMCPCKNGQQGVKWYWNSSSTSHDHPNYKKAYDI